MNILSLKNINKSYDDQLIFNNLNLNVKEGEVILIKGVSGIGKTTLFKTITRFISIDSGTILYRKKDIKKINEVELRSHIGLIFQDYGLFTHKTVIDNLILALIVVKKIKKEDAIKMAKEYLKLFNLEKKEDKYPDELSGGECQRVAIIRALLMKPDILLLDEPTSALDYANKMEVVNLIRELSKTKMTILMISHDDVLDNIADTKYILVGGKLKREN